MLGLVSVMRDWDLTTEAPLEAVEQALEGLSWSRVSHVDGEFASAYRLSLPPSRKST